jgi:hypothetical protein
MQLFHPAGMVAEALFHTLRATTDFTGKLLNNERRKLLGRCCCSSCCAHSLFTAEERLSVCVGAMTKRIELCSSMRASLGP